MGRRGGLRGSAVIAVLSVALSPWSAFAADPPHNRRWQTPAELSEHGRLAAPQPILEVGLRYDADATPPLSVKQLIIKRGYAPQYESLQFGYVLSLHAASGDVLSSLTFQIPNTVADPPPQAGESPGEGPLVLRTMTFALTVPRAPEAVELRVSDPQGIEIIRESLRGVPEEHNQPNFHSLPPEASSTGPSSSWPRSRTTWLARLLDFVIETAEAATTDGTVLDVTFVGDNYTAATLPAFHNDVDRAVAHLMTYEPFTSRASQIWFHVVDNTTVDLDCVHSATMDRLITCNASTVTSVVNSSGAPYDKIIVLVNDQTYGGSGGSIAVSYSGGSEPQVVVHEFGHSLGGLLDEYLLYSTNGTIDGVTHANCYAGTPPAAGWAGLVAESDYTLGCNYPNWHRSVPCSIMLTLSCESYNAVSQRQINAKLDTFAGSSEPTLTLSATPTVINLGGSSTLSWSATNVTSCTASGGWTGDKPASGSDTVSPTTTSTHTLTCAGASTSTTQSVTVMVDAQAPSVSITSPANGTTVTSTVSLSASAHDDQAVGRVDFFRDSVLLGSDSTAPYALSWNTSQAVPGAHTLVAQAVDTAGNVTSSAPAAVTVAADTTAPLVVITSPVNGATLKGASVTIAASASDLSGIGKIELLVDNASVAVCANTTSCQAKYATRSLASGAHTITATATDKASGANVGSASLTVMKK